MSNGFAEAALGTFTIIGIYTLGKMLYEMTIENVRSYKTYLHVLNDNVEFGKSPSDTLHDFRAIERNGYPDTFMYLTRMPARAAAVRHFRHIHNL